MLFFLEQLRKQYEKYKGLVRQYKMELRKSNSSEIKGELRQRIKDSKGKVTVIKRDYNKLEKHITKEIIAQSQAIATTLIGSDHANVGNSFSTVFIDEAAQALEPAAWVPISKGHKIVMAGDHFQLPPIVRSESPEAGLGKTLFEKIIKSQSVDILLKTQYRMHQHIMNFSNSEFYKERLSADKSVRNHSIDLFNKKNIPLPPVEFLDTANLQLPEQSYSGSKSWYNEGEAALLIQHLEGLLQPFTPKLDELNFSVGIISPYKGQVLHLKESIKSNKQLKKYNIPMDVNSIDAFQGQERDIIYISLVRSNPRQQIGFLSEKRRMNVAITRARKKLVIIGDSSTISKSEKDFYGKFIKYAKEIGAYKLLSGAK